MPSKVHALSLDLAASLSQPELQLKSATDDRVLGTMVGRSTLWPSVTLKTRERYFGGSHFGYSASAMAWYMRMNQQRTGGRVVNLGTSARGYFAYLTPTFYYRFGDRYSMESPNWMGSIGIGAGLGYLNVKGNMVTTETAPTRLEPINYVGVGVSTGLFLEILKKKWFFRVANYGPMLNSGSLKLELRNTSIKFGRSFEFDL